MKIRYKKNDLSSILKNNTTFVWILLFKYLACDSAKLIKKNNMHPLIKR